jgi:hypothetical protein
MFNFYLGYALKTRFIGTPGGTFSAKSFGAPKLLAESLFTFKLS